MSSDTIRAVLPSTPWQRCQVHLQRNAVAFVPKVEMRSQVARDIRAVFQAPSRPEADRLLQQAVKKYAKAAPRLSAWLEASVPEVLTVFAFPEAHRRRLRSSNMLEWLNREVKRRTRVASLFPNEASALRLVSAIFSETSDDWESGRTCLSMESS